MAQIFTKLGVGCVLTKTVPFQDCRNNPNALEKQERRTFPQELVSWMRNPLCACPADCLSGRGFTWIRRPLNNALLFVSKALDLLLWGHVPGVFLVVKFMKPNNNLFRKLLKDRPDSVTFCLCSVLGAWGPMLTSSHKCLCWCWWWRPGTGWGAEGPFVHDG